MKTSLSLLVAILVSANLALAADVKIKSLSYDPKIVEINQGESVTWKNTAYTDHSATSDDAKPSFDTGLIAPTKERSVTFKNAGTFPYHCTIHGKTMAGTVVVKPVQK